MGIATNGLRSDDQRNRSCDDPQRLSEARESPKAPDVEEAAEDLHNDQGTNTQGPTAGFLPFKIPLVTDSGRIDCRSARETSLLLSWLLVLLRYSTDGDVAFDWGYGKLRDDGLCVGSVASRISAIDPPLDPNTTLSTALAMLSSSLQKSTKHNGSDLNLDNTHLIMDSQSTQTKNDKANGDILPTKSLLHPVLQVSILIRDGYLWVRPLWNSQATTQHVAMNHVHAFVHIFRLTLSNPSTSIQTALGINDWEKSQLWKWNKSLPPTIDICMHDLISEQAKKTPAVDAICAWDGSLTYHEVDTLSTDLAKRITCLGVRVGEIVTICFEKSRWTVVAVLAVMKAGGAFVLLDPSQPLGRLQTIAEEVRAKVILTSVIHSQLGLEIRPQARVLAVGEQTFQLDCGQKESLPTELRCVPSSAILYIIFTSGSTGKPKGVVISHATYTSGAIPRANAVGYDAESRVLDFASYAFDVSIDSMLCTLMRGGCLCVPSNEERVNDLNGAIRRMGVTMANMTPSVARILDADIMPSLRSLGLGGETVSPQDVSLWGQQTRIVIGYGPSECTVGCTINSSAARGTPYVSIGNATGAVLWIVDPTDYNRLMPIGAAGELLVEGPVVDPVWLVAGHNAEKGRHGRLYKTGDIVKYDPDGSGGLVFVGRKDTQVKLRGQRVELGEVEHHLRANLPSGITAVAEVVALWGRKREPSLVAFLADGLEMVSPEQVFNGKLEILTVSPHLEEILEDIGKKLSRLIPVYMIPSTYVLVNYIPMTASAKTDRKRLRELVSSTKLLQPASSGIVSSSKHERILQQIWSKKLSIPSDQIHQKANFFALGGDSITAMKVVAAIQEHGFVLTVADVLSHPTLSEMALIVTKADFGASTEVLPFSLLSPEYKVQSLCEEAARLCGVEASTIKDIYPCTPLQEVLMAFSVKSTTAYIAQRIMEVPDLKVIEKLLGALEKSIVESPVLRTRIVQIPKYGLLQVVVEEPVHWESGTDLEDYLMKDRNKPIELGDPLSRYGVVSNIATGKRHLVWTIHHALYDGWSTPLVLQRVSRAYQGLKSLIPPQLNSFVRYLCHPDRETSKDFWRVQLKGATGPQYPGLPSRTYLPQSDALFQRKVSLKRSSLTMTTVAAVIRGAWALISAQLSGSHDIVFGETLTGRNAPIPNAEQIEGPMITTVPVRVWVDLSASVQDYLQRIHDEAILRIPHEHMGLQHIRKVSPDAQIACEIKTGLLIQPHDSSEEQEVVPGSGIKLIGHANAALEAVQFNSYPLMLVCSLQPDGFLLYASYDSKIVETSQMERIFGRFEHVVAQLSKGGATLVGEINCLDDQDYADIWRWNASAPAQIDSVTGALATEKFNITPGSPYPRTVVPWVLQTGTNQKLAAVGAVGELFLEGPILSTSFIENPDWLEAGHGDIPGRQGRLHRTGDLVKYCSDGSLTFIGRKATQVMLQGHTVDLAAIELHMRKHMPSDIDVVVEVVTPVSGSDHATEPLDSFLIAFVGAKSLPASEDLASLNVEELKPLNLSSAISRHPAAESLIGMEVALNEVLPPYMVPSVYLPLDYLPLHSSKFDRKRLREIGSSFTALQLKEIRAAFSELKKKHHEKKFALITEKEQQLRELWGQILDIDPLTITMDESFFRLGGDSVMAMKLVSVARQSGFVLSVANVFRHMRLGDMAAIMKDAIQFETSASSLYSAFSLLGLVNTENFIAENIRPALSDPASKIEDVLPTTDTQSRDVRGTVNTPRSSVQYNMLYFDESIHVDRLLASCRSIVAHHPILRTVFVKHGNSYLQVVLEDFEVPTEYHEAGDDVLDFCRKLCATDVDAGFDLGSTFLKFFFITGKYGKTFIFRISHAQYDGVSLPELMRHFNLAYKGEPIPATPSFTSYLNHIKGLKEASIKYWQDLLVGSVATKLQPLLPMPTSTKSIFITSSVDFTHKVGDATMATILTAAWSVVLSRLLSIRDVVFGGVTAGRSIDLPDVGRIMGPCYQYIPIRVKLDPAWTVSDLLDFVQNQHINSMPFESLGHRKIVEHCTHWSADTEFDSIVHHQDIEDFDEMPFGSTTCRVDIFNPHSEAGTQWKIVSFPKNGKMIVGILNSESSQESASLMLNELVEVINTFINHPNGRLFPA